MTRLERYRATGADLPFGDPTRAHRGVAMEGYFWRITDRASGQVIIALCGANRGTRGSWATVGLAGWPNGFIRTAAVVGAWTDPQRLGVRGGADAESDTHAFEADSRRLRVHLAEDAHLDVQFDDLRRWPHRFLGGSSVFQLVPKLNQYWHPWLLGGRASGTATLGETTLHFDDAQVYGEKNWGHEGFPESWWWGQAHDFAEPGACVAFAGGEIKTGWMRTEVTALVVRLPNGHVFRLGDPVVSPVRAVTSDERWRLSGRGFGWQVDLVASAPLDDSFVLPVPLPSEHRNTPGDLEHLVGEMRVRVRRFGRHVWTGRTSFAALEHGGLERARGELRRRGLDDSSPAAPAYSAK